jgi:hypothetical protein
MFQPAMKSGGNSELGVESQHLYRELDFVDHALAGRLFFRPQLQIISCVVKAIAVFVMYVFVAFERATEKFRHYNSMLVSFFTAAKMQSAVARRMHVAVFVDWAPFAAFPPAFFRAESDLSVVAHQSPFFCSVSAVFRHFAATCAHEVCGFLFHEGRYTPLGPNVKEIV